MIIEMDIRARLGKRAGLIIQRLWVRANVLWTWANHFTLFASLTRAIFGTLLGECYNLNADKLCMAWPRNTPKWSKMIVLISWWQRWRRRRQWWFSWTLKYKSSKLIIPSITLSNSIDHIYYNYHFKLMVSQTVILCGFQYQKQRKIYNFKPMWAKTVILCSVSKFQKQGKKYNQMWHHIESQTLFALAWAGNGQSWI